MNTESEYVGIPEDRDYNNSLRIRLAGLLKPEISQSPSGMGTGNVPQASQRSYRCYNPLRRMSVLVETCHRDD